MKKLAAGSWAFAHGLHTVLHGLEDARYDGLELGASPPHPTPDTHDTPHKRDQLRKEVADHGLTFSALVPNWRSHKVVATDDAGPFVAAFARHLAFAADLGIGVIQIDTAEPVSQTAALGLDPRRVLDRAVAAFGRCAGLAADRGVRVAWEFDPALALNRPSEVVAVVEAVRADHPNFGVLFDTRNAHLCALIGAERDADPELASGGEAVLLRRLKGKIGHVHLADSDGGRAHVPPGRGKLDFNRLIPELVNAGADDDWWCVDLGGWPAAWDALDDSRRFLDRLRKKSADS